MLKTGGKMYLFGKKNKFKRENQDRNKKKSTKRL
jgi:hypothetical protein